MKKFDILTTMIVLMLLSSCKKNEEEMPEPVNQAPKATLQVESSSEKLWNEVKVMVNAADADGKIVSVELFADNKSIGHDGKAPYEFNWDTRDFDDGEITLRAVITDDMDAVTKSEKKVEVMNTLINYDLHQRFLPMNPNYKYFTFITGRKGELLFFEQIESLPYKKAVLRPQTFDDERFNLHFAYANPVTGNITSFAEMSPGKFTPLNEDKKGKETGFAIIKFSDIPQHDYFTYGNYEGKELKAGIPYNVNIYEHLKTGYLYLRQGNKGLYKVIKDLKHGNSSVSLSSTGFEMEKHEFAMAQALDDVSFNVYGHTTPGPDAPAIRLFTQNAASLPSYKVSYHLPHKAAIFDHFSNSISFQINNKFYFMESYSEMITKPVMLNLNAQLKSNKLNEIDITLTGNDSYDFLYSSYYLSNNGFTFGWKCYSPKGDIVFPKIPSELTKAFSKFSNSNLVFADADVRLTLRDYDHMKGYDDFLSTYAGRTGKTRKEGGKYTAAILLRFLKP